MLCRPWLRPRPCAHTAPASANPPPVAPHRSGPTCGSSWALSSSLMRGPPLTARAARPAWLRPPPRQQAPSLCSGCWRRRARRPASCGSRCAREPPTCPGIRCGPGERLVRLLGGRPGLALQPRLLPRARGASCVFGVEPAPLHPCRPCCQAEALAEAERRLGERGPVWYQHPEKALAVRGQAHPRRSEVASARGGAGSAGRAPAGRMGTLRAGLLLLYPCTAVWRGGSCAAVLQPTPSCRGRPAAPAPLPAAAQWDFDLALCRTMLGAQALGLEVRARACRSPMHDCAAPACATCVWWVSQAGAPAGLFAALRSSCAPGAQPSCQPARPPLPGGRQGCEVPREHVWGGPGGAAVRVWGRAAGQGGAGGHLGKLRRCHQLPKLR